MLMAGMLSAQKADTASLSFGRQIKTSIFQADSLKGIDSAWTENFVPNNADSLRKDSIPPKKKSKNAITDKVDSKSADSIILDLRTKKVYLYSNAEVHYQNVQLNADYIETGFQSKIIIANGVPDSVGKLQGNPEFSESGKVYKSKKITYNFQSKRGIIDEIITQEGDGYLHGRKAKKDNDSIMYLSGGVYTTCDLEHPHFGIEFGKSKAIMGDRIITGPAYLSIENVPTPLVLPFGFFPFTQKRSSGILIPSPGFSQAKGYSLTGGGYYFALSDYYDLSLLVDVYTGGSWSLKTISNYYKRYKYKGEFDLKFEQMRQGVKSTPNYSEVTNFEFHWTHDQDPKANPNGRFSASVDFVSPFASKWSTNSTEYLTNTTNSTISYSGKFGEVFTYSAALRESYNTNTKIYNFQLPSLRLSSKQFSPFKSKKATSSHQWYENIKVNYTFDLLNNLSSPDSTLLKSDIFKRMDNGIEQTIPITSSIPVFKYFNWNNGITYKERWFMKSIRKSWDLDSNWVKTDTVFGFASNREVNYTSGLSTTLYGMFNFKSQHIKAIRHTMIPQLNFNFRPDFGNPDFGFWRSYTDSAGIKHAYSIFEGSNTYGYPANGKSGSLGISLSNKLEMKVKSKSDSITGTKKISLIDNLTVGMSYDFAKDSLNWSDLSISGYTTLFGKLEIRYSAGFTPYCMDSSGRIYNKLLWAEEKKLFKRTNTTWNLNFGWNLNSKKKTEQNPEPLMEQQNNNIFVSPFNNPNEILGNVVDFSIPWNLAIRYELGTRNYLVQRDSYKTETTQTLRLDGDFNLTSNCKIAFSTGYDFKKREITYTMIDFYYDLHCWEMRCRWIPIGFQKSWEFSIGIKANSLKDLKYEMRNDFRNTQPYL